MTTIGNHALVPLTALAQKYKTAAKCKPGAHLPVSEAFHHSLDLSNGDMAWEIVPAVSQNYLLSNGDVRGKGGHGPVRRSTTTVEDLLRHFKLPADLTGAQTLNMRF